MNQQSPQQQPASQSQMSTGARAALISAISAIVVAIITAIVAPIIIARMSSNATPTPTPIPTAIPSRAATQTPHEIYDQATSGTPVIDDSLSTNATKSWSETNGNDGACLFTAGTYHAIIRPAFSGAMGCFDRSTHFSNLAYQVEMTVIKGGGGGGLLFRNGSGPDTNGFGYQFGLFQDHVQLSYSKTVLISSTAIKAELNQTYLLTAIAHGNTINVYIDNHWVGSTEDNMASSGSIGLAVYGQANFTEVVFRNVKVWTLSS